MKLQKTFNVRSRGVWFMSDLHYNHESVIRMNKRPFDEAPEMNTYIKEEIQKKVKPGDVVFDLGDMFWRTTPDDEIIDFLKNTIKASEVYKLMGNHDKWDIWKPGGLGTKEVTLIADILEIDLARDNEPFHLILSHYPMISWNKKTRGTMMIHGHCHGNIDSFNNASPDLRVDVGFDGGLAKENGSFLIDFEAIYQHFLKKTGGIPWRDWVMGNCKEL